ncbi:hypothetical protein GOODEAATRI_024179 [Goodea atripinnis]|uniref:Rad21/Rec8-like protein N-terminal domain-containing protein n=1 Tax=Goodea atripinnis TaxID=208336 RepID=A0ABV0ND75_9TELE
MFTADLQMRLRMWKRGLYALMTVTLFPNQPRPRFSLYLSSQLQYGVVIIYHKQCGFLLGEITRSGNVLFCIVDI